MKILRRLGAVLLAFAMMLGCYGSASAADTASDKVIDPTKKVSLTLHKYEMEEMPTTGAPGNGTTNVTVPETAIPLPGVTFALYKVADNYNTVDDDGNFVVPAQDPVRTGTTNSNGVLAFSGLEQGRYLVVETAAPEHVYEMSPSFLVDLPMVKPDGTGWNYDVHAYPKNAAVLGSAVLLKTGEGDDANGVAGAEFCLQKKTVDGEFETIIEDIATGQNGVLVINNLIKGEYQLVETKAPEGYGINTTPISFEINKNGEADLTGNTISGTIVGLDFHNALVPTGPEKEVDQESVNVGDSVIWTITPVIPSDLDSYVEYTITDTLDQRLTFESIKVVTVGTTEETDVTEECTISQENGTVSIDLVSAKDVLKGKKVKIYITTKVNENVLSQPGMIPNQANITFENGYGTSGTGKSTEPETFVGNIQIVKENEEQEKLSGASFALYGSKQDAKEGKNPIVCEGKTEQTTGTDGIVNFKGLKAGTYYIVETKAPTYQKGGNTLSYNLLKEPKEIVLSTDEEDGVATVTIVNKKQGFGIPRTGSSGTIIMVLFGMMLISASVFVITLRMRRAAR